MVNRTHAFNPKTFLTTVGAGRRLISFTKGQTIYAQGDTADSVFVVQSGSVKLSVKSHAGKEATLDILSKADFVGKDSIARPVHPYGFRQRNHGLQCPSELRRPL
jgi:CRP-like cAMP-binding protein